MKIRNAVFLLAIAGAASSAMADANSMSLLYPLNSADPTGPGPGGGWTQTMDPNDDGNSPSLELGFNFCLYENNYSSVYVNNNGNISFGGPFFQYVPTGFPTPGFQMVAHFWSDVDTRNRTLGGIDTNLVWHRTVDSDGNGSPDVFVATWDSVGYFGVHNDKRNTFQVAIAADPNFWGVGLNAAFSYGDMQWTTGDASGGTGGFGGSAATVGLNNGDGIRYSQYGRFDHEGVDYNEMMGGTSGVSFLDNRDLFFNACEGIVPTPGTAALFGLGGACVLRRRRK